METLIEQSTPEAVLAARLNVPRDQFKRWRESGTLRESEHWTRDGRAFHITPAGEAEILRLIGLDVAPPPPRTLSVLTQAAGAMPRILRCKPVDGGPMVSVRLTGPRVFAAQFRRNMRLEVQPTEVEGIYEYDGPVPRRTRI